MLIKKLIQRLLDSRTTPEETGHSAMPSASETVLLTQNDAFQSWGNIHQGVAADDGYVNIFARSVNNTTSEMRVLTSGMTFSSAQTVAEKDMACSAPVAKGQTYTIKGVQVKGIKIIFVKTLGAIGGGYKDFIRRALSCLRALSNYLPRCFCKANPNGLRPKAFQKGGYSCHLSLLNMSLLTMDTLAFTKTLQTQENLLMFMPLTQLIQSLQGFAWALLRDLLHTQKLFLLEKAARSLSLTRQIQSKNYGSRRLSAAINNLEVGGALC